jgi:phosphoribosyl-ATP pyrophosphohydrolase
MHLPEFLLHLRAFVKKHGIAEDLPSRKVKLLEEAGELYYALEMGDVQEIIKEACDVICVCFHILLICGVKDILWTCFLKLEEVSARPDHLKTKEKGYNQ